MPTKDRSFAQTAAKKTAKPPEYVLSLYITGATPNSVRAVINLQKILEEHLPGRYSLDVIDVYQHEQIAMQEQLIALPMLIKRSPEPIRRMIGDLSNTEKVLKGLGLHY